MTLHTEQIEKAQEAILARIPKLAANVTVVQEDLGILKLAQAYEVLENVKQFQKRNA
jgi:2-phospho-L-lactate guanylyltransferase (CobY/MobA/RfbA family)